MRTRHSGCCVQHVLTHDDAGSDFELREAKLWEAASSIQRFPTGLFTRDYDYAFEKSQRKA